MKKLIKILLIGMVLAFAVYAFAANTTNVTNQRQVITITGDLDADWDASTEPKTLGLLRNGILNVWRVVFIPSASGDSLILRDGGLDAAEFFDSGICADRYDKVTFDAPGNEPWKVCPVMDYSDCTMASGSDAKIMLYISIPKP